MKNIFFCLLSLIAIQTFGQTTKEYSQKASSDDEAFQKNDTDFRVIYADKNNRRQQPAFFINGKFSVTLDFIKPDQIENLNVVKKDTLIENISYSGQIYITTKSDYVPRLISLTDLKSKYTGFNEMPVIFIIDGNFINAHYDNYLVDENNLLTIIVDKLEKDIDNFEVGLIKLLTKTQENINHRNKIMIRGKEVAKNN